MPTGGVDHDDEVAPHGDVIEVEAAVGAGDRARSGRPVVAESSATQAPGIGVPVPSLVTVPVSAPMRRFISGSTAVRPVAVVATAVGAPWNPAACTPLGSTR